MLQSSSVPCCSADCASQSCKDGSRGHPAAPPLLFLRQFAVLFESRRAAGSCCPHSARPLHACDPRAHSSPAATSLDHCEPRRRPPPPFAPPAMRLLASLLLLLAATASVHADVYMHHPRGSNDRVSAHAHTAPLAGGFIRSTLLPLPLRVLGACLPLD